MRLRNISFNNIRRRKAKALFVFLGLAIAVATVVLLTSIATTTRSAIDRQLDEYGANIVIVPKSDALTLSYGGITVPGVSYDVKELTDEDVQRLKTIKNKETLAIVSPKVIGAASANGTNVLIVGIDYAKELALKKWWRLDGKAPDGANQAMLGSEAAGRLKIRPGDMLDIGGRKFGVTGVLKETGASEDGVVFTDIAAAQTLLGKPGAVSMIEVAALCATCPIEEIDRQISAKLPDARVSALKQAVQSKIDSLDRFTTFSLAISVIVGFVGAMIVFVTMMASVNERTREIGVFRALGFRQSHIIRVILLEAFVVSVLGGLTGYAAGTAGAWAIAPRLVEIAVPVRPDPILFGFGMALAVGIGLLASLYPAVQASRMDPAQALRAM